MFLQELLRNIVTYKGVIKPYIAVWKEALVLRYGTTSTQVVINNKAVTASIVEAISISHITGTLTIPTHMMSFSRRDLSKEGRTMALVGNNICTVLIKNEVGEYAVSTGKTLSLNNEIFSGEAIVSNDSSRNSTIGFTIEKQYLFLLPETHGKRELLGGFSLSHEGNSFLHLSERG